MEASASEPGIPASSERPIEVEASASEPGIPASSERPIEVEASAPEVAILDRVTLPRSEVDRWIERLHDDYRPSAEARGLAFAGLWRTRGDAPDSVEVVVLWTVPGVREFFGSRATSHEATAWWTATDAVALRRERRVMQAVTSS